MPFIHFNLRGNNEKKKVNMKKIPEKNSKKRIEKKK